VLDQVEVEGGGGEGGKGEKKEIDGKAGEGTVWSGFKLWR
jgi:hypothetical protein